MAGLQLSTTIALIMLAHLHLKHSLTPSSTHFTSANNAITTNTPTTPGRSNSSRGMSIHLTSLLPIDINEKFEDGALIIFSETPTPIKFTTEGSGGGFFHVTFTEEAARAGKDCDDMRSSSIFNASFSASILLTHVTLPSSSQVRYICVRQTRGDAKSNFVHQGDSSFLKLLVKEKDVRRTLLPMWLQIILILFLLCVSGLFSGLNLGLMSLDKTELNIMIASGTTKERKYAKKILPLRKRGNFLLCTILLGNVLVNNCLTILLDNLTGSGISAIIASTFAIVLFGEIIPQAVCSRYGLAVGAQTIWFTKAFMLVTFPLSYPISLILDRILGEEIGHVYNRDRLRELLKLTEKDMDLQIDEFNIITGALDLSKKSVKEIMTPLDDVFMIESTATLDFAVVTSIMESGFTRVPIYEKERSNIVALLNVKDLALVDPENNVALKTVTQFFKHNLLYVFEDTTLDVILSDFKKGNSHMAMVQSVVTEERKDPYYKVTGLVTLEDVIEEIIQAEIYDEFDTVTKSTATVPSANVRKSKGPAKKDFSFFQADAHRNVPHLSPQLKLATFQYLNANLFPFQLPHVSEKVLLRLLNQNIVMTYTYNENIPLYLYQHSRPCDYFIFIADGRVEVQCGKENLTFEAGPFSYFGTQALLMPSFLTPSLSSDDMSKKGGVDETEPSWVLASSSFVPDFSVRPVSSLQYLKIRRDQYAVAYRATKGDMSRQNNGRGSVADDIFEREWMLNNQYYMQDTREDRIRRQMRNHSIEKSPTQHKNSLFYNLRKPFTRSPLFDPAGSTRDMLRRTVDERYRPDHTFFQRPLHLRERTKSDFQRKDAYDNQTASKLPDYASLRPQHPSPLDHPPSPDNQPTTAPDNQQATSSSPTTSPSNATTSPNNHNLPPDHFNTSPNFSTDNPLNDNHNHSRDHVTKKKGPEEDVGPGGRGVDDVIVDVERGEKETGGGGNERRGGGGGGGGDGGGGSSGGGGGDDYHSDSGDESSCRLLESPQVEFELGGSESTLDTKVVLGGDEKVAVVKL